jgi:pilus assembly protein Flp/PilA
MRDFINRIADQLRSREDGQAMVEYALILGLVSIVAIGALTAIGGSVNDIYTTISGVLTTAAGTVGGG